MPTERHLRLEDRLPSCKVAKAVPGLLDRIPSWAGRLVLDHGCGDAHRRADVESRGATYAGLDPYSASSDLFCAGERIPLADAGVDVVVSNAVLHLVPNPRADVAEIGRVLKPGGWFIGYVGFLEGDPEQARFLFSHLALSETLQAGGLVLEEIGIGAYGIDLQAGNLLVPFGIWPAGQRGVRRVVRAGMSAWMALLSVAFGWRHARRSGVPFAVARRQWRTWLEVAHAAGFQFTARKPGAQDAVSGAGAPPWQDLLRCPRTGLPLRRMARATVRGLPQAADRAAEEWLVAEDGSCAYPILGRQLCLAPDRMVALDSERSAPPHA